MHVLLLQVGIRLRTLILTLQIECFLLRVCRSVEYDLHDRHLMKSISGYIEYDLYLLGYQCQQDLNKLFRRLHNTINTDDGPISLLLNDDLNEMVTIATISICLPVGILCLIATLTFNHVTNLSKHAHFHQCNCIVGFQNQNKNIATSSIWRKRWCTQQLNGHCPTYVEATYKIKLFRILSTIFNQKYQEIRPRNGKIMKL